MFWLDNPMSSLCLLSWMLAVSPESFLFSLLSFPRYQHAGSGLSVALNPDLEGDLVVVEDHLSFLPFDEAMLVVGLCDLPCVF